MYQATVPSPLHSDIGSAEKTVMGSTVNLGQGKSQ